MSTRLLSAMAMIAVTLTLSARAADDVPKRPGVGDKAPEVALKTPAGQVVALSELNEGGPVVLMVLRGWPGYQCPICTRQVGEFIAKQKDLAAAGAQVLMVYPGPAEGLGDHADEFVGQTTLPDGFHFVLDPDYTITNLYGLRWDAPNETAYPATFVIDAQGTIRLAKVSDDHGGRASPAEVLEALKKP
jgi:peroxiredoxin